MARSTRDTSLAPACAGAAGLLLVVAGLLRHFNLSLLIPPCVFRLVTHLPCPTCGGTRCFMALSHGEIGRAFALNPLVTVGFLAILAWLGLWLAETWRGRPLLRRDWLTNRNVGLRITLGVILLAHWVYLCLTLPR